MKTGDDSLFNSSTCRVCRERTRKKLKKMRRKRRCEVLWVFQVGGKKIPLIEHENIERHEH